MDQDIGTAHDDAREDITSGSIVPPASKATAVAVSDVKPAGFSEIEKNEVFSSLVQGDTDIAGLVAYSIYKQNQLDWLQAFEAAKGRAPDEAERSAYIIGESTARRLATYRHLAEATLSGNAPALEGGRRDKLWDKKQGSAKLPRTTLFAICGFIAVLAAIAIALVVRLAGH